jgi:hypothetical protein
MIYFYQKTVTSRRLKTIPEFKVGSWVHVIDPTELCRSNLRAFMNIRNAYSTIMTNTLNCVIKVLTGLTIVLTIPVIAAFLTGGALFVFKKKELL